VAAAEPVLVGCEADLRCEVDRLLHLLAPAVEWTQRTEALLRLERLALGDAPSFAAFPELLLGLRDALAAQMQERRSAVSRQACRTVAALATASGPGFEPLAVHLLPVVFKALAMGIQVGAGCGRGVPPSSQPAALTWTCSQGAAPQAAHGAGCPRAGGDRSSRGVRPRHAGRMPQPPSAAPAVRHAVRRPQRPLTPGGS
jgi:hypothetical protein